MYEAMGMRRDKLADEVRDIMSQLFVGNRLTDPRLEGVTITHVKISADLQLAKI